MRIWKLLRKLFELLYAPLEAENKLTKTPGPPRFWYFAALAVTLGFVLGWWHVSYVVAAWIAWLACLLADMRRILKNTEASVREG